MSKVLTFSRTFPAYHPKAGQKTFFVEKILTQLGINYRGHDYFMFLLLNNPKITARFLQDFVYSLSSDELPKGHTIRSHKKPVKVGEFINPKCWAGKPYNKTDEGFWQIKFAPDIEVKKVWGFEVISNGFLYIQIDKKTVFDLDFQFIENNNRLKEVAKNDGLDYQDFLNWFRYPKPFSGQIICWNEKINY